MAIFRIRKEYERSSLFVGKLCLKLGLTPDVLTLTSIPISAVAAYALAKGYYIWSLVAICVAGGLDVLDGATARAGKTGSHFGTVFDHVADRYSEFIIWTGAALNDRAGPLWAMFAISGMVMSSYVRAAAESVGKMESCTVGFMGRVEKFFLLMGGMLIEASPIAFAGLKWSLIAIGVASHVTAVLRLLHARKEILKSVAVTEESE